MSTLPLIFIIEGLLDYHHTPTYLYIFYHLYATTAELSSYFNCIAHKAETTQSCPLQKDVCPG